MAIGTATSRRVSFVLTEASVLFDLGSNGVYELLGRSKSRNIARARQCAMAVLCDGLGMSQPEVGRYFEKDHTTVGWACKTVRRSSGYEQLLSAVRLAFPGEASDRLIHNRKQVVPLTSVGQIGAPGSSSPNSSNT